MTDDRRTKLTEILQLLGEAANVLAEAPPMPQATGDLGKFVGTYTDWWMEKRGRVLAALEKARRG